MLLSSLSLSLEDDEEDPDSGFWWRPCRSLEGWESVKVGLFPGVDSVVVVVVVAGGCCEVSVLCREESSETCMVESVFWILPS